MAAVPRAQAKNGKPPPGLADGGKCTWMKNGERGQARWLPKDHAFEAKLKARHHSRSFSRQQQSYKRMARLVSTTGTIRARFDIAG